MERAGAHRRFSPVGQRLFVVAVDLDTGESVKFGAPGYDHVPISRAVQASAALPGLYPPVEIDGRFFVDGALRKTMHASVALQEGLDLLLCLNPLVPFDARLNKKAVGAPQQVGRLVEGGLPVVLSQTFRALIHSRLQVGMQKYDSEYPNSDVVMFEPNSDDAKMFFTNCLQLLRAALGLWARLSDHPPGSVGAARGTGTYPGPPWHPHAPRPAARSQPAPITPACAIRSRGR